MQPLHVQGSLGSLQFGMEPNWHGVAVATAHTVLVSVGGSVGWGVLGMRLMVAQWTPFKHTASGTISHPARQPAAPGCSQASVPHWQQSFAVLVGVAVGVTVGVVVKVAQLPLLRHPAFETSTQSGRQPEGPGWSQVLLAH